MNKQISLKIASLALILFGFIDVIGFVMLFAPDEYLPANFESQTLFWSIISGLFGISRIAAGIACLSNKKWGLVFGLLLCLVTMIIAPTIIPFGIMDLIFAIIITICLLYTYFGNEKAVS